MKEVLRVGAPSSGRVFVASDAHYWPGKPSAAHRALCLLAQKLEPAMVVLNGDMVDGASISKHPPLGWEKTPSLVKELQLVRARLAEIRGAAWPTRCIWTQGNHDARFDKYLALKAPKVEGVYGTKLEDFFTEWEHCVRLEIGKGVVVKHSFKGGTNPTKSNTVQAGKTIVTGHHHSQNVTAFTDFNGTRWGVDAGMLAAVEGPQFAYNEGNPVNWRSGFAILEWIGSKLCPPTLVQVLDEKKGRVWYNGGILNV